MNKYDKIFYEQAYIHRKDTGICGEEALFYQDKSSL
jgi:hypothetical protein